MCGARRPTKLMSPVTLTAAATVSVANEKTCFPDRYAEHAGLIFTDRECQKMAVEQEDQRGGDQDDHDRKRDFRCGDAGETSHDPVFDRGELFFRICHEL